MTNQELFNKACEIFRDKDFKKCINERGNCVYYNPVDGNRCIIGKLLTLETAKGIANRGGITTLFLEDPESLNGELKDNKLGLLSRLQSIHDQYYTREFLERDLKRVAEIYKLNYVNP